MAQLNSYGYFHVHLPHPIEQRLRAQPLAQPGDTRHALILRHLKRLSAYLQNATLKQFAIALRPEPEELYLFCDCAQTSLTHGKLRPDLAEWVNQQLNWFLDNYYEYCDTSVSVSLHTHGILFLLEWSLRLPTDYLTSPDGKFHWLANHPEFRLGQVLTYTQLRSRLRDLHISTAELQATLTALDEKGYLYPVYGHSSTSVQLLLPLPKGAIAGEITSTRSTTGQYALSLYDHVLAGMVSRRQLPVQYSQIMAELQQGRVYLIRKRGVIVAVMTGQPPPFDHKDYAPAIALGLTHFSRHELQQRMGLALRDLHRGLWSRLDVTFPVISGTARYISPPQLHVWHPAHYAIAANPRLAHWAFLIDDQQVYARRYGNEIERLQQQYPTGNLYLG